MSTEAQDGGSRNGLSGTTKLRLIAVAVALTAAASGGFAVLWHKVIRHELYPRNFGVVVEGEIYRSGRLTERATRKVAEEQELKTILDLGAYEPGSEKEATAQRVADELGVKRVRFDLVGDGTGNPNYYVQALRMMTDPAAQPILVHCAAGAQRTGACMVLYRHIVEGVPIAEAYAEAQNYKHDPASDWEMLAYVAEYKDEIERALKDGTQIAGYDEVAYPLDSEAPQVTATDAPDGDGADGG